MKAPRSLRRRSLPLVMAGMPLLVIAADEHRAGLTRLTTKVIEQSPRLSSVCAFPTSNHGITGGWVHLYANEKALAYRRENPEGFAYPIGSVFLKEKHETKDAKEPKLATVMKRIAAKGKASDWEYSMISLPDGKPVTNIRKENCASCHAHFEKQGFVSFDTDKALRKKLKLPPLPDPKEREARNGYGRE